MLAASMANRPLDAHQRNAATASYLDRRTNIAKTLMFSPVPTSTRMTTQATWFAMPSTEAIAPITTSPMRKPMA